jgi:hypothetical protein
LQNDATIRKSTRLRKLSNVKKQDLFMVNDNHNSVSKWEGIVDGTSRVMNNSGILPKPSCGNSIKGKAASTSSRNTKLHKKPFHRQKK